MSTIQSEKAGTQTLDYLVGDATRNASVSGAVDADTIDQALIETNIQKNMTIGEAVRRYPRAIFFSVIMSLCIVMEGYDTALIGNFYGLTQFNKKFGVPVPTGGYQIPSEWQSAFQNGAAGGQLIGLLLAGQLADKFGYIKTVIAAQIFTCGCIFLMFFAQNRTMLLFGYILCGLPWGAFQSVCATYAADVTPMRLRPILTTFVNMCWVIGQFLSVGVLRGLLGRQDQWAWRIPYAIQWIWPPLITLGLLFAPESPAWLVKVNRIEQARVSLRKLCSGDEADVGNHLALLIHTDAIEKEMSSASKSISYLECFKGTNLRRTEATCGTWMVQVLCGIWFGSNIVYFLQRGGLAEEASFNVGLVQNALGLICTGVSWFVMTKLGRRTIYLLGLAIQLTCLVIVGFLGIPRGNSTLNWISGAFLIIFVLSYQLTVGPICYCLVTELPSTRLRIKTVALARMAYNVCSLGANFLNPPILNPLAWNLRGKGGFVWAGLNALCLVWTYFRLPETKGLTIAEIDVLFEHKVSARKFKTPDAIALNREQSIAQL
jgi:SP family general alpha glucoside:H+ symporter-like MFS transporter